MLDAEEAFGPDRLAPIIGLRVRRLRDMHDERRRGSARRPTPTAARREPPLKPRRFRLILMARRAGMYRRERYFAPPAPSSPIRVSLRVAPPTPPPPPPRPANPPRGGGEKKQPRHTDRGSTPTRAHAPKCRPRQT